MLKAESEPQSEGTVKYFTYTFSKFRKHILNSMIHYDSKHW